MSDEDWMKNNKFMSRQHYFCHSRASNSEVKYQIWPKFKLVQNFIDVLITCKSDQDWIKNKQVTEWNTFLCVQGHVTLK